MKVKNTSRILKTLAQGLLALCFMSLQFQGLDLVFTYQRNEQLEIIEENNAEVEKQTNDNGPLIALDIICININNESYEPVKQISVLCDEVYSEVVTFPLGSRAPANTSIC